MLAEVRILTFTVFLVDTRQKMSNKSEIISQSPRHPRKNEIYSN